MAKLDPATPLGILNLTGATVYLTSINGAAQTGPNGNGIPVAPNYLYQGNNTITEFNTGAGGSYTENMQAMEAQNPPGLWISVNSISMFILMGAGNPLVPEKTI